MKSHAIVFSIILLFSCVFVPRAFADGFAISTPTANQMVSETGILHISWAGTVASANSYPSSDTSAKILHIYIYPYGASYSGPSAMEIGSVNADTSRTLDWNVPKGVVGYFKRAAQYQLVFTQNGQTSYSAPFFLWDSTSPLWNPTSYTTSSNTSTSQSSATTYASPNFQVNSAGVYVPANSTAATVSSNPVYTYTPVSTWVYRPIDAGVWATSTNLLAPSGKSGATTTSSTTTATASGCIDLKQDLYLGIEDMTNEVTSLQKYLSAVGHFDHTPTGSFGLLTQAAVKKFQAATGISQTGYVGPVTRAKIKSLTCAE